MTFLIIVSCLLNAALAYLLYKFWKSNELLMKRKTYYKKKYQEQKQQYFNEIEEESNIKKLYEAPMAKAMGDH